MKKVKKSKIDNQHEVVHVWIVVFKDSHDLFMGWIDKKYFDLE